MASLTAADVLVNSLIEWGVDMVFGMPGDGINGIIEALRTRQDRMQPLRGRPKGAGLTPPGGALRFIQVRHEEAAAFNACGYAKWTGRLGVCLATSGPGGIHLLNGLYDAKLDGQPVLAITGLQFHDLMQTHTQQDVELDKLFMDVCVYNARIMGPAHVENVIELACRTALAYRGVAHVTMPVDVQSQKVSSGERSERNIAGHVSDLMAFSSQMPSEDQLARAVNILNGRKKTVILAGRGALGAGPQLIATAERLAAPIAKPLLGKAAVPDDNSYTTGGTGLLGTRPSQEALENCDSLLIAGSSFPYIEFYPKPDQAKAVQIDLDPKRIGLRYPVEAGLVGDTARVLEALLPRLERREDRSFLENAQSGMKAWNELMHQRATRTDKPMKPQCS